MENRWFFPIENPWVFKTYVFFPLKTHGFSSADLQGSGSLEKPQHRPRPRSPGARDFHPVRPGHLGDSLGLTHEPPKEPLWLVYVAAWNG